jgi:hypothetical protein
MVHPGDRRILMKHVIRGVLHDGVLAARLLQ